MSIIKSLNQRRTYYAINKQLPVKEEQVIELIKKNNRIGTGCF